MTSSERLDRLTAMVDQLTAEFERIRKLVLIAMLTALIAVFVVEVRT